MGAAESENMNHLSPQFGAEADESLKSSFCLSPGTPSC